MDNILDVLEKRIEALEQQVLPKEKYCLEHESRAITDILTESQSMITTALSCREAITSILRHMTTINDYLDPCNGEDYLELEAKRHYLLELYPELKDTVQLLGTLQDSIPYANSDHIIKITELWDKLEQLASENLAIYQESGEGTQNVLRLLQEYHDIISSIKVLFAQLDRAITSLEVALQPKFVTEE